MPQAKKRPGLKYNISTDDISSFDLISEDIRKDVVKRRLLKKKDTEEEFLLKLHLRRSLQRRKQAFIPPQTEEEKKIRLKGIQDMLSYRKKYNEVCIEMIALLEGVYRSSLNDQIQQDLAQNFVTHQALHDTHISKQSQEINLLHKNLLKNYVNHNIYNDPNSQMILNTNFINNDNIKAQLKNNYIFNQEFQNKNIKKDKTFGIPDMNNDNFIESSINNNQKYNIENDTILNYTKSLFNNSEKSEPQGVLLKQNFENKKINFEDENSNYQVLSHDNKSTLNKVHNSFILLDKSLLSKQTNNTIDKNTNHNVLNDYKNNFKNNKNEISNSTLKTVSSNINKKRRSTSFSSRLRSSKDRKTILRTNTGNNQRENSKRQEIDDQFDYNDFDKGSLIDNSQTNCNDKKSNNKTDEYDFYKREDKREYETTSIQNKHKKEESLSKSIILNQQQIKINKDTLSYDEANSIEFSNNISKNTAPNLQNQQQAQDRPLLNWICSINQNNCNSI